MKDIPQEVWQTLRNMTNVRMSKYRKVKGADLLELESRGLYSGYKAYCKAFEAGRLDTWEAYCGCAIRNGLKDAHRYNKSRTSALVPIVEDVQYHNKEIGTTELEEWMKLKIGEFRFSILSDYYQSEMTYVELMDKYNISLWKLRKVFRYSLSKIRQSYHSEFNIPVKIEKEINVC